MIILGIMVLIAVFGPYSHSVYYTDADFTAINMAPNAKHWFGTDGAGIDLYACVVHGLGRSLTIGISYAILTTIISAMLLVLPLPMSAAFQRRLVCGFLICSWSFLASCWLL